MEVSALEAVLQAMCAIYSREVKKTTVYQHKKFRQKRDRALEFTLSQLINIARELAWFPSELATWAGSRTDLGSFIRRVNSETLYIPVAGRRNATT
jgi:hypothetical protein